MKIPMGGIPFKSAIREIMFLLSFLIIGWILIVLGSPNNAILPIEFAYVGVPMFMFGLLFSVVIIFLDLLWLSIDEKESENIDLLEI